MNKELDEFVALYGFDNKTEIEDMKVAMDVTRIRKERETRNGNNIRNDRTGAIPS